MKLQTFESDAPDRDAIEALQQDGACVALNQAPMEITDAVHADFRAGLINTYTLGWLRQEENYVP